jgi:hypothetical protein
MSNFAATVQESVLPPPLPMRPLTARFLRAAGAIPRTKAPGTAVEVGLAVTVMGFETVVATVAVAVAVAVLIESQR